MHKVNLQEAQTQLAELIEEVANGKEVIIFRNDGTLFQIIPVKAEKPYPKFGSAKGLIEMSDDFDEQTYGSCQDDPIVIDSEGDFEQRKEIV